MHRSLIEVCLLVMAAILLVPAYGWSQEHGGHGEAGTPVRDARFGVLFTGGGSRDDLDTTPTLGGDGGRRVDGRARPPRGRDR